MTGHNQTQFTVREMSRADICSSPALAAVASVGLRVIKVILSLFA